MGESILPRCPSALALRFSLAQPCGLPSSLVVWHAGACERWSGTAGKALRRSMREELAEELRGERRVHCRRERWSRMRRDGRGSFGTWVFSARTHVVELCGQPRQDGDTTELRPPQPSKCTSLISDTCNV
jgi:hypothetical protein